MKTIVLAQNDYLALTALARQGLDGKDLVPLDQLLQKIEQANGMQRYMLWVQWQEATAVVPVGAVFPKNWPANLRTRIEQIDVPITQTQVLEAVSLQANRPIDILVTPDPNAVLGWSTVEQYFAVRT